MIIPKKHKFLSTLKTHDFEYRYKIDNANKMSFMIIYNNEELWYLFKIKRLKYCSVKSFWHGINQWTL